MSNETFTRENRYEVIKVRTGKKVEAVVIEKGWPEYELVWQMLENRVVGNADRVLEDKEREIAELKDELVSYKKQVQYWKDFCEKVKKIDYNDYFLLQAYINDLREALEVCKYECHTGEVIGIAQQALSKTPAQSLQSFENEVIERCANDLDRQGFNHAADAIRALKVTE